MAEATIGALANLATATAADRGVVAALTRANYHLAKQLEDNSPELRELKDLLDKERRDKWGPRCSNPSAGNYCWNHGYKVGSTRTSLTCKLSKPGHKSEATLADNMGGSQANRECAGVTSLNNNTTFEVCRTPPHSSTTCNINSALWMHRLLLFRQCAML
jgi:hypothetical protein